jgi:branched-chain amino acid transport system permease protein
VLLTILSLIIDAVSYGMVLFIISIGLSIMMGLMRVVNLAHGAFAMIGGYLASYALVNLGAPYLVAALIAVVGTIIISIPFELLLYRRIYRKSDSLTQLLLALSPRSPCGSCSTEPTSACGCGPRLMTATWRNL